MAHWSRPRWHRLNIFLLWGAAISGLQAGINAFCGPSPRRPSRAYGARRSAISATTVRERSDGSGDLPTFESIEDLEALTVVRLKEKLKARGLKQSGKKADLVRLLAMAQGVISPPCTPGTTPPPAAPVQGNVLTDEEVARWMEEDTIRPLRQDRSASKRSSSAKNSSQAGANPIKKGAIPPPVPVVAEEVLGGIPAAKTFSSSRLGSAAAAKELIKDAELAEARPPRTANPDAQTNKEKRLGGIGKVTLPSSSSAGVVGSDNINLGGSTPPKNTAGGGSSAVPPPQLQQPQLPGPTEEMRKKAIIMDLLERRETTFELEEGLQPSLVPRSDVYVVSTKKALRPWDGPHSDRAETHVVVLLTDVYGYEDSFTRNSADEIAEICDAIVVVPDMFRKRPWTPEQSEEEYEAWRASHDPDTVAADIRACVDFARKEFKPTSLGLVGFCFGGGRALEEAAAGVVKPDNVVVFYPTRYDVGAVASNLSCPVAAFFAEHDVLPGASVEDAQTLREQLGDNDNVPDFQVKLCPGAGHGFAHRPMKKDKENAEDAMLLATSWLDIYMQKHFRIEAEGVKESEFVFWELPARIAPSR
ncbi:unnamed protein product [Hapterophycus canaliculatus]